MHNLPWIEFVREVATDLPGGKLVNPTSFDTTIEPRELLRSETAMIDTITRELIAMDDGSRRFAGPIDDIGICCRRCGRLLRSRDSIDGLAQQPAWRPILGSPGESEPAGRPPPSCAAPRRAGAMVVRMEACCESAAGMQGEIETQARAIA
ncbi:MAG: hypothetical protein KDH15_10425 [Rhodocyclaceae bacterium]|nr:hypothetical protein [Rhodocyclaceae bacterium]